MKQQLLALIESGKLKDALEILLANKIETENVSLCLLMLAQNNENTEADRAQKRIDSATRTAINVINRYFD